MSRETIKPGITYGNSGAKNINPDWYKCFNPKCLNLKDRQDSVCPEKERGIKCPFPTRGEWQILNSHLLVEDISK